MTSPDLADIRCAVQPPTHPRPVVFIGAGGIVNDAHMPAYRALGIPVAGVFDIDPSRAAATASRWAIPEVFSDVYAALAAPGVVFDLAVPPDKIFSILEKMPEGAVCLIQKPFGTDLADATRLREICRAKRLVAAVNFQLRFSPNMLALREAIRRGVLGRLVEVELSVNCRMPWELWPFLETLDRMELALHSIHYLDLMRALLGEPRSVYARTVKHPFAPKLASSRSTVILDYADDVRCALTVNHHHRHGPEYQRSEIRVEGTRGAAVAVIGVNLDYPKGRPDSLRIAVEDETWHTIPLDGQWFPDAFRGTMANLQRFAAGEDEILETSVEDAWKTMALVETCYASDRTRGTPLITEWSARG